MKLYLTVIVLLGCVCPIKNDTYTKLWGISTTYNSMEYDFEETKYSISKMNLTNSVYVERYSLDSVVNILSDSIDNQSFFIHKVSFQKTVSRKHFFLNDSIDVYKIYWNKENTDYDDFSSFILYTKKYGVVYKFFRKQGKEFFRWRLLSIKNSDGKIISLNDFTKNLLNDTILFDKAALMYR